jgi:C-terminal processing protease CtpA/Prc
MKRKIKWLILPIVLLLSACQFFLGPDPDTSPPEVLKSLWNDFNNIHANLDIRMSNNHKYNSWYDVYYNNTEGYALKVFPDISEDSLFNVCAEMLRELNDPHVALYAPGKFSGSYPPDSYYPGNYFNINLVRVMLNETGYDGYANFVYGRFSLYNDIGYIYISTFMGDKGDEWGKSIDTIISSLADTKVLILDVRNNRGGDVYTMEYIAARFASLPKDYLKARVKTGPGLNDLSSPIIYTVKSISKASGNQYGYTKPIVLVTNKSSVSAAEWFTLALRTQSNVTHVGKPTCGALSSRNDRFMINGWAYSISPERVTDMNDKIYEGIGISPEIEITEEVSISEDRQLLRAIEIAKDKR